MREIRFYETASGQKPIEDFLDKLSPKQAQKVTWVLKLIEDLERIPSIYFKKMINTEDLWEVRVAVGSNIFRLICFFDGPNVVVLAHAFQKKTQKTHIEQSGLLKKGKMIILGGKKMSDLNKYIKKRKTRDPKFKENYDSGYEQFKIGALLKQAREEAGLTQQELAARLNTKKSAISRIENHAEDIKLSTLKKFANALGKELRLEVT